MRKRFALNLQYFAEGGEGQAAGGAGSGSDATGNTGGHDNNQTGEEGHPQPSFDDFLKSDPKNQAEFDRRLGKALETSRSKMQAEIETKIAEAKTEAEKLAKMNADQKAQYAQEKKEAELKAREAEITKRELSATAKETLADKGLPIQLADILNYESAETCNASIEAVEKSFKEAVQKAVDSKLKGGEPMKKAPEGNTQIYTKEQIENMTPAEINKNWDSIQESLKRGL